MENLNYLGNYSDWIQPEWREYFQTQQGQPRPSSIPIDDYHTGIYDKAAAHGYDLTQVHFWYFKHDDVPFKIVPPWLTGTEHYWWMVKMKPSQFMNMHQDPDINRKIIRYWMPWEDYEPGHVFVVNNELITGYKAGDLFSFKDPAAYHGSSNIGYSTRYSFQVSEFFD